MENCIHGGMDPKNVVYFLTQEIRVINDEMVDFVISEAKKKMKKS